MARALVCVPIAVRDPEHALADAARAKDRGADLVEWRVDGLYAGSHDDSGRAAALRIVEEAPLPVVLTCRAAAEGGAYEGDEPGRADLIEAACALAQPPRYIDIEHAASTADPSFRARVDAAIARTGDATGLILSWHDFEGRPTDLLRRVAAMRADPSASVLKMAFRARSLRDNLEVFEILAERDRPTIALAMGEFGTPSRVLAGKFGGLLTFASLRDESATAPGQVTVDELLEARVREIGPQTRVYGVVGWPVAHSVGPAVHNAAFAAMGHDGAYLRLPIESSWESFKATMLTLIHDPRLDLRGVSVTIPHKRHLLRLAEEQAWPVEPIAARVGAANTLALAADRSGRVANTDVDGVMGPLGAAMGDLRGRRVSVLGAGGAARAAVGGLVDAGATVEVSARRMEQARLLADEIRRPGRDQIEVGEWGRWSGVEAWDAVVQCTPVGMAGGPEPTASPLDERTIEGLRADAVVFESVYRPRDTPLIRLVRPRGNRVIDGVAMFAAQAMGQLERWTGMAPERGLIERICGETLASI